MPKYAAEFLLLRLYYYLSLMKGYSKTLQTISQYSVSLKLYMLKENSLLIHLKACKELLSFLL